MSDSKNYTAIVTIKCKINFMGTPSVNSQYPEIKPGHIHDIVFQQIQKMNYFEFKVEDVREQGDFMTQEYSEKDYPEERVENV